MPRKGKVYPLSREKREKVHKFIKEQLRKGYIRPLKLLQMVLVFFVEKKDRRKSRLGSFSLVDHSRPMTSSHMTSRSCALFPL